MPASTLLHIGFPKSASSALQKHFFGRHPEVVLLGKPRDRSDPMARELLDLLRSTDSIGLPRSLPRMRDLAARLAEGSKLAVLSAEELSVGPYWEGRSHRKADRGSILATLQTLFPRALVLIVVREQLSLLQSWHAQLRAAGTVEEGLDAWLERQLERLGRGSVLDALFFADMVESYSKVFGSDRLLVVDVARLEDAPVSVLAEISAFCGIAPGAVTDLPKTNARRSKAYTRWQAMRRSMRVLDTVKRLLPGGVRSSLARAARSTGPKVSVRVRPELAARVREVFRHDNARLEALTGIALARSRAPAEFPRAGSRS